MKILHYVVELEYQDVGDDIRELTGWKDVRVYTVDSGTLNFWFEVINCNASDPSVDLIEEWLISNGYGDEIDQIKMRQL